MKKQGLIVMLMAAALVTTGCASKKELENCQNENRELTTNYQSAKEELAASKARVSSLEDQLAQQKKDYAAESQPKSRQYEQQQYKHLQACRSDQRVKPVHPSPR